MPFKIITVPFNPKTELFSDEELNKFVFGKTVSHHRAEFFLKGDKAYWTVFLEYESIIEPVNKDKYKMNDADGIFFEKLRAWRKAQAEKAGVPVYVVSTNQQLVQLVKEKPSTLEALKRINGFGKKKLEVYGKEITEMVKNFYGNQKE